MGLYSYGSYYIGVSGFVIPASGIDVFGASREREGLGVILSPLNPTAQHPKLPRPYDAKALKLALGFASLCVYSSFHMSACT